MQYLHKYVFVKVGREARDEKVAVKVTIFLVFVLGLRRKLEKNMLNQSLDVKWFAVHMRRISDIAKVFAFPCTCSKLSQTEFRIGMNKQKKNKTKQMPTTNKKTTTQKTTTQNPNKTKNTTPKKPQPPLKNHFPAVNQTIKVPCRYSGISYAVLQTYQKL